MSARVAGNGGVLTTAGDRRQKGMEERFKYWAFISYSHQDKTWGDWLHKTLERYRVPSRLVGRESRDGSVPRRLFPIFRDREELPTSSSLGSNLSEALSLSRYLIVICSPRSAVSRWVNEEVKAFKAMGREDRILCLIVDGEPNASDIPNSGLLECFPQAVRFRVDAGGNIATQRTEPIAADARDGKDGKADAKLKLLAGLCGVSFDELKRREKTRLFWRRLQWASATFAILATFAGSWTWISTKKRIEAHVEAGRQELLQGQRLRGAVFLSDAYSAGDDSSATRFLLAQAMYGVSTPFITLPRIRHVSRDNSRITVQVDAETAEIWDMHSTKRLGLLKGIGEIQEFSPDKSRIATRRTDGSISIWDTSSSRLIASLKTNAEYARARFSPDGRRILTTSEQKAAGLWDAHSGTPVAALDLGGGDGMSGNVRFSPDGTRLLFFHSDNRQNSSIRLWDTSTGHVVAVLAVRTNYIKDARFSPDSSRIVVMTDDGAELRDAKSGKLETSLAGVVELTFSPDGSRMLTNGDVGSTRVWTWPDRKLLMSVAGGRPVFSPDGARILTFLNEKSPQVWDSSSGNPIAWLEGHTERIEYTAFSGDGLRIVTASEDRTAKVWDASTGGLLASLEHSTPVRQAAFSADGLHVFTISWIREAKSGREDLVGTIWNVPQSQWAQLEGHARGVAAASFNSDGTRIVTASEDRTAKVWDVSSGKLLLSLEGHKDEVMSAAFSPNGSRIVTVSWGKASFWDASTGKHLGSLEMDPKIGRVLSGMFSADGSRLLIATTVAVEILNARNGDAIVAINFSNTFLDTAALSPDGKRIVTGERIPGGIVRVLDASTGALLATASGRHEANVEWVGFTSDGLRIVSLGDDGWAKIWDASTGKELRSLGRIPGLAFIAVSPDASRVVLGSRLEKHAGLWDTSNGKLLASLQGHTGELQSASFSPDGARIVTTSADRTAKIWDASNGRMLASFDAHTRLVKTAVFSPDGARIVITSGDPIVWDARMETRSPAEIASLVKCRAPWRLEGGKLVPAEPDRKACPAQH